MAQHVTASGVVGRLQGLASKKSDCHQRLGVISRVFLALCLLLCTQTRTVERESKGVRTIALLAKK